MSAPTPHSPNKYLGTQQYLIPFVTRNRQPTGADYRQPETGKLYPLGAVWQVGKNPVNGLEGDLWYLTKIVANVAFWVKYAQTTPDDAILSLTGNTGPKAMPDGTGNIPVIGNNNGNNGYGAWAISSANQDLINMYGTVKWVVNSVAGLGTSQTIQAAHDMASAGDTVFVTAGDYPENLTITKNINFVAYGFVFRNASINTSITGKITTGANVNVGFRGFNFITNSDYAFVNAGTNAALIIGDSYFTGATHDIINQTGSNAQFYIKNCGGFFAGTNTLGAFPSGGMFIDGTTWNDAGTPNPTTFAGGSLRISNCNIKIPFSISGGGEFQATNTKFGVFDTPYTNYTYLTTAGTAPSHVYNCEFYSGTAPGLSLSSSSGDFVVNCTVNSSNMNAITGTGTINYCNIAFTGSSSTVNTSTKTALPKL